jgi:5-methylcytosine-specific restriction enzyme A
MARDRKGSDRRYGAKRKSDPDFRFRETQLWRRISKQVREAEPFCRMCAARHIATLATQVDHVIVPNGRYELQVSLSNLQPLCAVCHGIKSRADHGAWIKGCDERGVPIDPRSHFRTPDGGREGSSKNELPLPADGLPKKS